MEMCEDVAGEEEVLEQRLSREVEFASRKPV
jgi:hypothetical protein